MSTDAAKAARIIREIYLPAAQQMLREHEEYCRTHPHVAQFLASLPNGDWRRGALAGEEEPT